MKHLYKLLLIPLLLPLISPAQSNFQRGFVVTLNNDTVGGYLDYQKWDNNPRQIFYKRDANAKPVKYTLKDISFFAVEDSSPVLYKKYAIRISMDNTDLNHIQYGRDSSYVMDTVFLKISQMGKNVQLFSYDDNIKTRFYTAEHLQDQPEELGYRIYYKDGLASGRTVTESTYRKQLYALALKYNVADEELKNDIERTEYKEDDLAKITAKINKISPNDPTANHPKRSKHGKLALMLAGFVVIAYVVLHGMHFN
ncbi:hypothetical protein BH09BAC6_BH09BAC6_19390 [soil metagenome]|jgi:hypothetical protein